MSVNLLVLVMEDESLVQMFKPSVGAVERVVEWRCCITYTVLV